MGAVHRITRVTATKWTWLLHCWRLRPQVVAVVQALEASPTNLELSELKSEIERLQKTISNLSTELETKETQAEESDRLHTQEYAKLKEKYDKRLRATGSEQVEALKTELRAERDAKHLVQIELDELKKKFKEHLEEHEVAKDGNRALLRFIHTRHRLNVKFDPASIRGALQRQENQ